MKNKTMYYIIGGVALLGVGYYFLNKRNKPKTGKNETVEETDKETDLNVVNMPIPTKPQQTKPAINPETKPAIKTLPSISQNVEKANIFRMGYISFRPNGVHVVMLLNRPPSGTIRIKDKVKITGTSFDGVYTVKSVFIDDSKRVGGIHIPIKYTPTGRVDTTFKNKGLVELI